VAKESKGPEEPEEPGGSGELATTRIGIASGEGSRHV
jgi:hypothetical protein